MKKHGKLAALTMLFKHSHARKPSKWPQMALASAARHRSGPFSSRFGGFRGPGRRIHLDFQP